MAVTTNSPNKKRTGPSGPVPADFSRHHRIETTHRDRRQQRWPFQVRQTSQISYQIQVGPRFPIQLSSASTERFNDTSCNKAIAFGSCKCTSISICNIVTSTLYYIQISSFLLLCSRNSHLSSRWPL